MDILDKLETNTAFFGTDISWPLNYLKTRFPSVHATQVSVEDDIDLITKEGIRICSDHLFLSEFV